MLPKYVRVSMIAMFTALNSSKTDILARGSFCGSDWLIWIGRCAAMNMLKVFKISTISRWVVDKPFTMAARMFF